MHFSSCSIIASVFIVASSFVNAAAPNSNHYPLTTINSQDDFCIFLPPKPGLEVAPNENNGIPFCFNQNAVPKANLFPQGFITTAHYLRTSKYVQITGFFDRTKYSLGANDGGGQYDNHAHGKPVGAQCKGYNYFVNLIEPDIERFCIRCCQDKADCNTGRSGYGCLRVVDGDYTRDNNMVGHSGNNSTSAAKKKSNGHSNSSINSVLADLDALPSDSTDASSIDDDSSSSSNPAVDELDDLANNSEEPSDDASSDDTSSTTTTTGTNVSQKIISEIQTLKSELANQTPVDQVQTEWKAFTGQLAAENPDIATQINQLTSISSALTTPDQLNNFFDLALAKLQALEGDTGDDATATATATPTPSLTHTDTNEDLDWLYNHRNSHDNQATW
ncbi:hypothetical protein BCV72DRAFT_247520 [Rhizopus microsporus var. microsporus]|uniref:Uncharacterized protein n=2 Tax=Rhizopus microsporus TaxID=58291 RepID=A0A1X0REL7_RHIZD|nr:hypothetical protein BCV72DRAFT_247520 [Rhizopus microsporus var. microsporus]